MKTGKDEYYSPTKNPDGTDMYCPLDSDKVPAVGTAGTRDNCVEKDVVERYSGNIDIRS